MYGVDKADCVCVSEAVVLAEEEREAFSLRIRPARFASSRLPGSLKLFDDRTGQHHCRWRAGGERTDGIGVVVGGEVWKPVICIQLFLSSCPAPLLLLLLFYLFLCSVVPCSSVAVALFLRPLQALKKSHVAAGHPSQWKQVARSGNNCERH